MVHRPFRLLLLASALVLASGLGSVARAQTSSDFSAIAGKWTAHGMGIDVGSDGQAAASWRVYTWCTSLTQPAPCDSIIGNEITDGGLAMLQFRTISAGSATAFVLMSTDSSMFSTGTTVTLQIGAGGVAQFTTSAGNSVTLCGPHFDPSLVAGAPCGA